MESKIGYGVVKSNKQGQLNYHHSINYNTPTLTKKKTLYSQKSHVSSTFGQTFELLRRRDFMRLMWSFCNRTGYDQLQRITLEAGVSLDKSCCRTFCVPYFPVLRICSWNVHQKTMYSQKSLSWQILLQIFMRSWNVNQMAIVREWREKVSLNAWITFRYTIDYNDFRV